MNISASGLNTFSKCGHQYYLKYIQQLPEGRMPYRLLQGKIVGEIIQAIAELICIGRQRPTRNQLHMFFSSAYHRNFTAAQVPQELTDQVLGLIDEYARDMVIDPHRMNTLDEMSHLLNEGTYSFTPPPPLRRLPPAGYSTDKKRFGNMIVQTVDHIAEHVDLYWDVYLVDRVEAEVRIDHECVPGITSPGYFDLLLFGGDGGSDDVRCFEYKYSSANYTEDYLRTDNQAHIYYSAVTSLYPNARLFFCNLADPETGFVEVCPSPSDQMAFAHKLVTAKKAIETQVFIPVCGAGAYDTQAKLCSYRDNGCSYGGCA